MGTRPIVWPVIPRRGELPERRHHVERELRIRSPSQEARRVRHGLLRSEAMSEQIAAPPGDVGPGPLQVQDVPRGRGAPLEPSEADRLFREGVALFNGVNYWHAHEAWEAVWRAAPDGERDFYQGLIQVAAGLLHLQRRNARGARNKLAEGIAKLRPFMPAHGGIFVSELVGKAQGTLDDLNGGHLPYLIPPVIRYLMADEPDWSR